MLHDTPARDSYMYQSKYSRSFGGIAASTIRGGMVEYIYAGPRAAARCPSVRPSVRIMMTPTIIDLQIDGHHGSDGSALLPASTSLEVCL